jgi:pantoate ligase/cytidylate kinase
MGALHPGHLSLISHAHQQNQVVIVSIFVNPLQFGVNEDLGRYPRQLEQDLQLCQQAGVDAVFAPTVAALLPPSSGEFVQVIPPSEMTHHLCGAKRVGHFQGVATIVVKLLNLVKPNRVYFGQKDAQQLAIIRRCIRDLNLDVEVVACPIVREASGLASSSRNKYLSLAERGIAAMLYQGLQQSAQQFTAGERSAASLRQAVLSTLTDIPTIQVEYVELVEPETLQPLTQIEQRGLLAIAASVGQTRLIDNWLLDARQPILAIDGPAGAGKSTVTRLCAQALGLQYLDTGAMYRAITWLVVQAGIDSRDTIAVAELVGQCRLKLTPDPERQGAMRVWVNDQDVTGPIRSLEITRRVSEIAAQPAVRRALIQQQRRYAQAAGVAVEGRDMGTHVFPDAGLKIFLTASVAERARRRQQELIGMEDTQLSLAELITEIEARDYQDSHRPYAPFRKANDAIEVQTDGLTIAAVVEQITQLYLERFPQFQTRLMTSMPASSASEALR